MNLKRFDKSLLNETIFGIKTKRIFLQPKSQLRCPMGGPVIIMDTIGQLRTSMDNLLTSLPAYDQRDVCLQVRGLSF